MTKQEDREREIAFCAAVIETVAARIRALSSAPSPSPAEVGSVEQRVSAPRTTREVALVREAIEQSGRDAYNEERIDAVFASCIVPPDARIAGVELAQAREALVSAAIDLERWRDVRRIETVVACVRHYKREETKAKVAAGAPCPNVNLLGWSDHPCDYCGKGHGPASRTGGPHGE